MSLFGKKKTLQYDPAVSEPAVRKSICTGEMTVGFVDRATGKFHDVRLVDSQAGINEFMKEVGAESIKTIY